MIRGEARLRGMRSLCNCRSRGRRGVQFLVCCSVVSKRIAGQKKGGRLKQHTSTPVSDLPSCPAPGPARAPAARSSSSILTTSPMEVAGTDVGRASPTKRCVNHLVFLLGQGLEHGGDANRKPDLDNEKQIIATAEVVVNNGLVEMWSARIRSG